MNQQLADGLVGSDSAFYGGWLFPTATIVVVLILTVTLFIVRERYHRARRTALEGRLTDLESLLFDLASNPGAAPPTEPQVAEPDRSDESFSPRGPLSTAISLLRSDAGPMLPGPDRIDLRSTCFIYENLERPLTPGELAEGLNLSLRSLQRGLAGFLSCTPRELILAIKMREAKRALVVDEARVQEAARAVGFDDPFHFSRRFKAYYGVSPTEMQDRINRSVA